MEKLGKKGPLRGVKPPNLLIIFLFLTLRSCALAPPIHATNKQDTKPEDKQRNKERKAQNMQIKHTSKGNKHASGDTSFCTPYHPSTYFPMTTSLGCPRLI